MLQCLNKELRPFPLPCTPPIVCTEALFGFFLMALEFCILKISLVLLHIHAYIYTHTHKIFSVVFFLKHFLKNFLSDVQFGLSIGRHSFCLFSNILL